MAVPGDNLREMAHRMGDQFAPIMCRLLERGHRKRLGENIGKESYIDPSQISLQELWLAEFGTLENLRTDMVSAGLRDARPIAHAMQSSAFPVITGTLISSEVIAAYQMAPNIGDQLVRTVPGTRKTETMAGFTTAHEGLVEVPEGTDYPEVSLDEYKVTMTDAKYGRRISVTRETILFDQTNQILDRARGIGSLARAKRETLIIEGIVDKNSTVFRPQGSAEAIYRSSAGTNSNTVNLVTDNALQDWDDVDSAIQQYGNITDATGEPIDLPNRYQLVVPLALNAKARNMVNATEVRIATDSAATTTLTANPLSSYGIEVYTSTRIATATSDSTTWFIGDFPAQFVWYEIWPIETVIVPQSSAEMIRDVNFQYKVGFYGGCAATDDTRVIKNTA